MINSSFQSLRAWTRSARDRAGFSLLARLTAKIAFAFVVWHTLPSLPLRVCFGVFAFGYLQRCLISGPGHEAIHNTLFRNSVFNDLVGITIFASVFVPFKDAQRDHFKHHRYLGLDADPEVQAMKGYGLDPEGGMTRSQILWMLARPLLSPPHLMRQACSTIRGLAVLEVAAAWVVLVGPALFIAGGGWLIFAWWVASWTVRKFLWLLANSSEHDFPLARDLQDIAKTPKE
jgi:fatty acid desaturase